MTIYEVGTLALSATATLFAALAYIAPVKAPAPGAQCHSPTAIVQVFIVGGAGRGR
jgi:hypothetical protein